MKLALTLLLSAFTAHALAADPATAYSDSVPATPQDTASTTSSTTASKTFRTKVLIIGGGVSGIAAARALKQKGVTDFIMLEARTELGGRVHNVEWPKGSGNQIEIGANWVEGVRGASENPLATLADKYNISRTPTNWDDLTYRDAKGKIDKSVWEPVTEHYDAVKEEASDLADQRNKAGLQDMSLRAAYKLLGWDPRTPLEMAVEWNGFDSEQAETPDVSSLDFTADMAFFGEGYDFVVDQRGFKYIFEQEAKSAGVGYGSSKLHLGKTVKEIQWAKATGSAKATDNAQVTPQVTVKTKDGYTYIADYAISSVSLGVLQSTAIKWTPPMPSWKTTSLFEVRKRPLLHPLREMREAHTPFLFKTNSSTLPHIPKSFSTSKRNSGPKTPNSPSTATPAAAISPFSKT